KFSLGNREAVSDGRWWAEGTPIWETADAHGLRTATMFWPGSEADIRGRHPDYWQPYDGKVTPDERVDQVLAWLDLPATTTARIRPRWTRRCATPTPRWHGWWMASSSAACSTGSTGSCSPTTAWPACRWKTAC